eukprot:scaffold1206_cov388-Prasinococcus_capsulatus_cf.AAC.9
MLELRCVAGTISCILFRRWLPASSSSNLNSVNLRRGTTDIVHAFLPDTTVCPEHLVGCALLLRCPRSLGPAVAKRPRLSVYPGAGLYPVGNRITGSGFSETDVHVRPYSEDTLVPNIDGGCERFAKLLAQQSIEFAEPDSREYEGVQAAIIDALGYARPVAVPLTT